MSLMTHKDDQSRAQVFANKEAEHAMPLPVEGLDEGDMPRKASLDQGV